MRFFIVLARVLGLTSTATASYVNVYSEENFSARFKSFTGLGKFKAL